MEGNENKRQSIVGVPRTELEKRLVKGGKEKIQKLGLVVVVVLGIAPIHARDARGSDPIVEMAGAPSPAPNMRVPANWSTPLASTGNKYPRWPLRFEPAMSWEGLGVR